MCKKENIEDWKPYGLVFGKNAYRLELINGVPTEVRNIFYYDRSWYCNETGNIHHSVKSVLNCVDCDKKYN